MRLALLYILSVCPKLQITIINVSSQVMVHTVYKPAHSK